MTAALTLTDFLLARIAEDEHFGTHDRHLSNRWAVECEAKRRIVAEHPEELAEFDEPGCATCDETNYVDGGRYSEGWPCQTLRALALPYADHPDYDETWRP